MRNDQYRLARGGWSRILELRCFKCGAFVAYYQKDGSGPLKRSYLDRFITPIDGTKNVVCKCGQILGIPWKYEPENNRPCVRWFEAALKKKIVSKDATTEFPDQE